MFLLYISNNYKNININIHKCIRSYVMINIFLHKILRIKKLF